MQRLRLPSQLIRWVKSFMTDRKIQLAFDGQRQEKRPVRTGIPQGSPISPILFLIYIRHIFSEIKSDPEFADVKMPSFIDDVAFGVESKSAKVNCSILEKIAKKAFNWADKNAVKFDDSKTELIHFESAQFASQNSVKLPNDTVIKPKTCQKWLGVYLDRKLNFKKHVQEKTASAKRVLIVINRLQNSEWGLPSKASKQLYQTCINSISDYGAEIWWKSQSIFVEKFQKIQNFALRKILGCFRTSPVSAMEIEANILPIRIRMHRKCQKYALRILKMDQSHPIRLRTPRTYPPEYENGTDEDPKFSTWNQDGGSYPTQIIRILHTMKNHVDKVGNLENIEIVTSPWKSMDHWPVLEIPFFDEKSKKAKNENAVKHHQALLRSIFGQKNTMVYYTDGAQNTVNAASSSILYYNSQRIDQHWNLGNSMDIVDAEVLAIEKSIDFCFKNIDE